MMLLSSNIDLFLEDSFNNSFLSSFFKKSDKFVKFNDSNPNGELFLYL